MLEKTRELYLAELAEQMAGSWTKVGVKIGWFDPVSDCGSFGAESVDVVRELAQQCLAEERMVRGEGGSESDPFAVPVFSYGRVVGTILCAFPEVMANQAEGLFEIFNQQLRQIQQDHQHENELTAMSEQLAGSYEELSLIYKLGQQLQISDDPGQFLARFADELMEQIRARGVMLLVNRQEGSPSSCFEVGRLPISGERAQAVCRYLMELSGAVCESIILPDLSSHPTLVNLFCSTDYSVLAWPICANGRLLGILAAVSDPSCEGFDSADAKLMGSVAEHTGSFLQNRFLLTDIQELLTGLLTSLVSAIDAKDPYTRGHSQRVAYIGQRIAEAMGLDPKECAQVHMAGLLHDIGKIGISDQVLSKPGKLTREEFATVQEHPVIGSRIISSVKQLRSILPGVLNHHERYDGTGYPEGLQGEQIPLMGMIVGLADCFDAITSDRTYHDAMSFQDALTEIRHCSGRQFSPIVVTGLFDCDLQKLDGELKNLSETSNEMQFLHDFNWLDQCR